MTLRSVAYVAVHKALRPVSQACSPSTDVRKGSGQNPSAVYSTAKNQNTQIFENYEEMNSQFFSYTFVCTDHSAASFSDAFSSVSAFFSAAAVSSRSRIS